MLRLPLYIFELLHFYIGLRPYMQLVTPSVVANAVSMLISN